jgi:hypothetical protein
MYLVASELTTAGVGQGVGNINLKCNINPSCRHRTPELAAALLSTLRRPPDVRTEPK